ncbi:MAG: hypothetical protein Q9169_003724 [Polycauliona sp. 2 TL-2023]
MVLRALNENEQLEMEEAQNRLHLGAANTSLPCSFQLRDPIAPGRGKGYRASHLITPGTLILCEQPLFVVEGVESYNISRATRIRIDAAVQRLTPDEQNAYRQLCNPFPRRTVRSDEERFYANNFEMEKTDQGATQGIFLEASRFNHSCIPNAWCNWNPHYIYSDESPPGTFTVYAIRNILQGEEIVVNYRCEDAYMEASERRGKLKSHYNFRCCCPACQPGGEHAARRLMMDDVAGKLEDINDNTGTILGRSYQRQKGLESLAKLLEDEELEYPQKADVYGKLAEVYFEKMNRNEGKPRYHDFRSKARDACRAKRDAELISVGEYSEEVRNTLHAMQRLT